MCIHKAVCVCVGVLFWQPPSVAGFRGDDTLFPSLGG